MNNLGLKIGLDWKIGAGNSPPPVIPAWAAVIRALGANPSDLLFTYNFAAGGEGQGWNNVAEETLALAACWETPFWGGTPFAPSTIIDGLGLGPSAASNATTLAGLIQALPSGGTLFIESKAYVPVTVDTVSQTFVHLVDNPDDNFEGGLDLHDDNGADESYLTLSNGNGSTSIVDTITGKQLILRGACNYTTDGTPIVGSINGRANVNRNGSSVGSAPNTLAIHSTGNATDVPVYLTIVAVFLSQLDSALPGMSTLP